MALTTQDHVTMLKGVPAEAWRSITIDGTHVKRRWLTVFQHEATTGITHRFGLFDDGTWSALYADGIRAFTPGNFVPFLPLLEDSWSDAALHITSALRALGVPDKLAWSFPLDQTLVLGLKSSELWRTKAEQWISSGYPLTDELAALAPMHPRVRRRYRERMTSIFGSCEAALRAEFDAQDGSFLIKLRVNLEWDKNAFNRLTGVMHQYVRERDPDAPVPRWIGEGFWYLESWVREWSSHEAFARPHGHLYYEAAYERLHALAYWLFTGSSMYEGKEAYAPL